MDTNTTTTPLLIPTSIPTPTLDTSAISIPISNRGMPEPTLDDIPAVSPIPDWLTAHNTDVCPTKLPRFPRTKEHLELEELTFAAVFENILDVIIEGGHVIQYLKEDPRDINYGRFQKWIKKDKERQRRYEEAQEIGTEALLEKMDMIAAGTEVEMGIPEDIERSKLRLAQLKFKVQSWNKRRYGNEKETVQPFGAGGIVINIGAVDSPYANEKVVSATMEQLK